MVAGRLGRRSEQVAQALQRFDVALSRLDRVYGELEVEHGLGGKTRNRSRADVLRVHGHLAQRCADALQFGLGLSRPSEVVLDDADRRVETVVQRRMSLLIKAAHGR